MKALQIDTSRAEAQLSDGRNNAIFNTALQAFKTLTSGTGKGNEYLGWLSLPETDPRLIDEMNFTAQKLANISETIVVIGIGGSYLGCRAVMEALRNPFRKTGIGKPEIIFAGHHLSPLYHQKLLEYLSEREFSVIVISKSGTTTEPAIAFRLLKKLAEKRYGAAGSAERIVAVTDERRGALKAIAVKNSYKTFIIPDDVGGRFSVLTPVAMLPLAAVNTDIQALLTGAAFIRKQILETGPAVGNPAFDYALARNLLFGSGKKIEILASYEPGLSSLAEWWKQLFGESEGKDGKGIFPVSVNFTSDLHSMGQYIQDGPRSMFMTSLIPETTDDSLIIPHDDSDTDGLNYLAGKNLHFVNTSAFSATSDAHYKGGVPQIAINIPDISAESIGQLLYFFEFSCGISAYMLDVNPFDQPGVEAYKNEMFRLLGKPGF
jgi:glucose-6-phosphate isomerase